MLEAAIPFLVCWHSLLRMIHKLSALWDSWPKIMILLSHCLRQTSQPATFDVVIGITSAGLVTTLALTHCHEVNFGLMVGSWVVTWRPASPEQRLNQIRPKKCLRALSFSFPQAGTSSVGGPSYSSSLSRPAREKRHRPCQGDSLSSLPLDRGRQG